MNNSSYSVFSEFIETDYISLLRTFNPIKISQEHQNLIKSYRTPQKKYLSPSQQSLNYNEVANATLQYLIERCWMCQKQEKYEACIVTLYKLYENRQDIMLIEKVKNKLTRYIKEAKY